MAAALLQLCIVVVVFWWLASFLTLGLVPPPGPSMKRGIRMMIRAMFKLCWRHGFKNQFDRRGFFHACGHALALLVILATIGALASPAPPPWHTVALWWGITAAYWLFVMQWHRLKKRKRQLPHRRW